RRCPGPTPKCKTGRSRSCSPSATPGGVAYLLVLADDPELQAGGDAGGEAHGHLVLAERLDRAFELDPTVVDLDVRLLELIGDVTRGDRTEQLLVLADLTLELQRHAVDARRDLVRVGALLGDLALDQRLLVVEA